MATFCGLNAVAACYCPSSQTNSKVIPLQRIKHPPVARYLMHVTWRMMPCTLDTLTCNPWQEPLTNNEDFLWTNKPCLTCQEQEEDQLVEQTCQPEGKGFAPHTHTWFFLIMQHHVGTCNAWASRPAPPNQGCFIPAPHITCMENKHVWRQENKDSIWLLISPWCTIRGYMSTDTHRALSSLAHTHLAYPDHATSCWHMQCLSKQTCCTKPMVIHSCTTYHMHGKQTCMKTRKQG